MQAYNSVSKGTFLFKNGLSLKDLKRKKQTRLINRNNENQEWYDNFKQSWSEIEGKIEQLQSKSYEKILSSLLSFIQGINFEDTQNLQTAVLLTGVNQTDHMKHFETLSGQITNNCHSITAILRAQDCPSLKVAVEFLVGGFVNEDEDRAFKKKQLTFAVLEAWYNDKYCTSKPSLVVMIADFEQFNSICVQELISILCSYTNRLPFVLIVGVATAFKTLHNVLPAHITNKLDSNIFQSESSTVLLNKILDEVILTHHSPVKLSGRSFKILMDGFLFYDFSLHSFIKGYRMFLLEHFMTRPLSSILHQDIDKIRKLNHGQCETIRRSCPSFRRLVESTTDQQDIIDLIKDDKFLKEKLPSLANDVQGYFYYFFCSLRILEKLLEGLPRNELGKQLRQLYPICFASDVTKLDEYKECMTVLKFTSKEIILPKIDAIIRVLQEYLTDADESQKVKLTRDLSKIEKCREAISVAGMSPRKETQSVAPRQISPVEANMKVLSRQEMMKDLQEKANKTPGRVIVEYERRLYKCLDYLNGMFEQYLKPVQEAPALNEFFIFSDAQAVRQQIVGAPRAVIFNRLTYPHHYLQCTCCAETESDQVLPTHPDTAIAFKLHLENNKYINLYDWLQSFTSIVEGNGDDSAEMIQARFTRSISDLQFLGFIKPATKRTDHVIRLTW